ncbi:MAG: alpha/beta fold hydrolase [Kiritimatiellae bacterium]|nr:alpha/beta fold hydrolase [Kiritimatiellia bacterium]
MRSVMLIYNNPLWPLALLAAGYLALVLWVYFSQERLLYFPDNSRPEFSTRFGLRPWPDIENFRGFVSSTPLKEPKGIFMVWHGNAGSALDRTYFTDALERRGWRVILAEYPGYCGRAGQTTEKSLVADALATIDLARREFNLPICLVGESLGCGVAAAAAKERPWINGVILITPWADLPELAQAKYPYLPARWLARDRYDNINNLRGYNGPVAVLLAEHDEVVPRRHGRRLFDSLAGKKHLMVFPSAGHNSWPSGADEKWWDEVIDFIAAGNGEGKIGI